MLLPPAPVNTPFQSYAWYDWYQKVRYVINNLETLNWSNINFAGSKLTDIQTRNHNDLQNLEGGEPAFNRYYHVSFGEYTLLHSMYLRGGSSFVVYAASDPTTSDLFTGMSQVYHNTTSGTTKLWANISGTMKSVTLT